MQQKRLCLKVKSKFGHRPASGDLEKRADFGILLHFQKFLFKTRNIA